MPNDERVSEQENWFCVSPAKEGTDRRLSERRIHPAVAQYAVADHARLVEQVRVLRETLDSICGECAEHPAYLGDDATDADIQREGGDAACITFWHHSALDTLAATSPRESAKQERT